MTNDSLNDSALQAAKDAYATWALEERIPLGKDLSIDLSLPIAIKAYLTALKTSEISLPFKPTEAMCDEARGFILGIDCNIRNWQDMEKHLDRGGYSCIPYIREMAAQGQGGHITKWEVADCIWQLMAKALAVSTREPGDLTSKWKHLARSALSEGSNMGEMQTKPDVVRPASPANTKGGPAGECKICEKYTLDLLAHTCLPKTDAEVNYGELC